MMFLRGSPDKKEDHKNESSAHEDEEDSPLDATSSASKLAPSINVSAAAVGLALKQGLLLQRAQYLECLEQRKRNARARVESDAESIASLQQTIELLKRELGRIQQQHGAAVLEHETLKYEYAEKMSRAEVETHSLREISTALSTELDSMRERIKSLKQQLKTMLEERASAAEAAAAAALPERLATETDSGDSSSNGEHGKRRPGRNDAGHSSAGAVAVTMAVAATDAADDDGGDAHVTTREASSEGRESEASTAAAAAEAEAEAEAEVATAAGGAAADVVPDSTGSSPGAEKMPIPRRGRARTWPGSLLQQRCSDAIISGGGDGDQTLSQEKIEPKRSPDRHASGAGSFLSGLWGSTPWGASTPSSPSPPSPSSTTPLSPDSEIARLQARRGSALGCLAKSEGIMGPDKDNMCGNSNNNNNNNTHSNNSNASASPASVSSADSQLYSLGSSPASHLHSKDVIHACDGDDGDGGHHHRRKSSLLQCGCSSRHEAAAAALRRLERQVAAQREEQSDLEMCHRCEVDSLKEIIKAMGTEVKHLKAEKIMLRHENNRLTERVVMQSK